MRLILKAKWWIIAAWIVVISLLAITQPNMSQLIHDKGAASIPDSYSSSQARDYLDQWQKQAGTGNISSAVLVFYDKHGLSETDKKEIKKGIQSLKDQKKELAITDILDVYDQPSLKSQLISKNNKAMLISLNLDLENKDQKVITEKLNQAVQNVPVEHHYTSDWMITNDTVQSSQDGLHKTEYLTIIFILVVLFIVFRSAIAPFIPLVAVGLSFLASQSVVAFLSKWFNFPISTFTQIFLVAVLFGIGTDYCILLINRFKEEIPLHETIDEAVIQTIKHGGRTVFFSSLTVFIGFATIGFSTFNIYRSAVGVAVGIAFLILSLVTVVPILMSLLGTRLFWPMNKNISHSQSRLWKGVGHFAWTRPFISLIIVAVIIVPLFLMYNGTQSFNSVGEMSDKYDAVKGFNLISQNFNPGESMPTTIVLKNDENMNQQKYLGTIQAITQNVEKMDHVKTVLSATQPEGSLIKDFLVPSQAQTLSQGLDQTNNGVQKIASGLNSASSQLKKSQPELEQATGGINQLVSGTESLKNGVIRLQAGLTQIQQGMDSGHANSQDIASGLQKLKTSAETLLQNQQKLLSGYQQLQSGLSEISTNYHRINSGVQQLKSISSNLSAAISSLEALGQTDPSVVKTPQYQQALGILKGTDGGLNQMLNGQGGQPGLLSAMSQMDSGLAVLNNNMKTANSGLAQLVAGQQQYNNGLQQVIAGINRLSDGLKQATGNIPKLSGGFDQVINGQTQLKNGFSDLGGQMKQLTDGLGTSANGLNRISGGLDETNQFVKQLSTNNGELSGFYIPNQALQNPSFVQSINNYMSKDRKITKLNVVFDVSPYSLTAIDQIDPIKSTVERTIKNTSLENAKVAIGGTTSDFNDLSQISSKDYGQTVRWMLIGIGIVLIVLLRSFVMPAYIIGSLTVTYYAAMSIAQFIFQHVLGYAGVNWAIPFFGFVILVALGVDYSIFLMDRFNENRGLPIREAMLDSMTNIGSVIMSAALILMGTFAAMIPAGVSELTEIATIIITGIIIYNVLMLPLFMPVMVRIFGSANWWPFKRGEAAGNTENE
ncbi:MMPL family transporter [Sporolactobacillus sp. CQH2019]|uniref:MMPL family transporter n=1 Tax=Sporolactobacillus sp. CQH2019 TaxID=3023512 RepID=UPI002367CF77|nr:MMPL family transporter [Sporolactobacillus sp. CQH2019]MDD9150271.1 MMPL family transporter [Sporolactobacillus sp. CQH2019]